MSRALPAGSVTLDARGRIVAPRGGAVRGRRAPAPPVGTARRSAGAAGALAGICGVPVPDARWRYVDLPLALPRRVNGSHGHHAARNRVAQVVRDAVGYALSRLDPAWRPALPCGLVVTRVAPRPLDRWDNLPVACKSAVDAWCAWAAVDDGHPQVFVAYRQARPAPGEAPTVRLAWRSHVAACGHCDARGWGSP